MRLPDLNNYKSFKTSELIQTIKFDEMEEMDKTISIMTDKDKVKFIKEVEKLIRGSLEYKDYIKFLKKHIHMNRCSFFENVTTEGKERSRTSIEIHHEPFTLFDLVQIVMDKQVHEYGEIDCFLIAEEVMHLHYQCKVGLLPLSKTVHELVHTGDIFIPLDSPRGDFISFLEEYDKYISNDLKDILQKKIILSKQVNDLSMLETKYTYIEIDGISLPQLINPPEGLYGELHTSVS